MRGALLCWLPFSAGCSVFFDFTVEQCKFDADCSTTDDSLQCERNLCVSRLLCEKNSDCVQDSPTEEQICVEGKCQTLVEEACFERFPKGVGVRDNAIVLGAFGPRNVNPVSMPLLNYELAVSELNSAGGLKDRQVVLVVCDNGYGSGDEMNTVDWGFKHLASRLRVPAIVAGLQSPRSVQEVFLEYRKKEAPPFLLVPFAGDGMVIDDDDGLIWYLLNVSDATQALVALIRRVEEGLPQQGHSGSTKVAVWKGSGTTASALWESLEIPLRDAYPEPESLVVEAKSREPLDALVAAKPQIVLVVDGEGFVEQLGKLEAEWQVRWGPEERLPVYVLPPQYATSTALPAYLVDAPAEDSERFVGVHPRHLGDPQVLERYAQRFEKRFPSNTRIINDWNYYDAVYYLAYAAFAGAPKGGPVTNLVVQKGFVQLKSGEHVEVGPDNIASAVEALSKDDGRITFEGVLGPAAFGSWSGMPTAAGSAVFCLTREADEIAYHHEVLVYNAVTGKLDPGTRQPCSGLLARTTDP